MKYRTASADDAALLAKLNHQLIREEGHRNRMTVPQLEARMRRWLAIGYVAVIFEDGSGVVAYAVYVEDDHQVYLRHFFVVPRRRRAGLGREAIRVLREELWSRDKRLVVEVLWHNERGVEFWRAMGFREYSLALEILPDDQPEGES